MIAEEGLLRVARSQAPVLSVYLNMMAQDPSRHPTVPPGVTWFRREAKSMSRASSPREAKELLREVQRVEEFLEGRHQQEKALAIFAGQKAAHSTDVEFVTGEPCTNSSGQSGWYCRLGASKKEGCSWKDLVLIIFLCPGTVT